MENNDKLRVRGTSLNIIFSNIRNNGYKNPDYFYISFDTLYFKKGDLLKLNDGVNLTVLKVYNKTLLKTFLNKLGFKFRMNQMKIKMHE